MPVYAYQCTECGTAFDVRQSFTDDALTVCEACGGRLRKRFDAIGVTFKGSGFYRTDSRAGASGSSESGDTSSSTSSAKPAAAKDAASSSGTSTTASKASTS